MAKDKATKKTHNDIDDLPPEETPQEFDEESPADVLGIDMPDAKEGNRRTKAKAEEPHPEDRPEPDERPGDDVLRAVAEEAARDADTVDDVTDKDEEPDEDVSAEPEPSDADEPEEEQLRTVRFERDGEVVELTVPESQAKVLEGYMAAADTTRDKYSHLQGKYLEAIKGSPPAAQPSAPAPAPTPEAQADARLNQMMGAIPQVVEAYAPVVKKVRDALPEENELREFIEDQPVIAAILAAMWDGQSDLAAQGALTRAERAQSAFRNHVDGLINNIIKSDEANSPLADPDVRDKFDEYLVTLGPIGPDGEHDPRPVRAALMQDDGRWLAARWGDFQLRAALAGGKPVGGTDTTPPPKPPSNEAARRRAIDPGGASRTGGRPRATPLFSKEVSDVLNAK